MRMCSLQERHLQREEVSERRLTPSPFPSLSLSLSMCVMVLAHRQVKHTGDPQEQVLPVEQPAGQTAAWEERDDNRETDGGTGCIRGRNNEDQGGCEMQP